MSRSWYDDDETGCGVVILCVLGLIALAFIGPAITMWLWNWVATDLFSFPAIGYWQALGLTWLCKILFGRTVTVKRGK